MLERSITLALMAAGFAFACSDGGASSLGDDVDVAADTFDDAGPDVSPDVPADVDAQDGSGDSDVAPDAAPDAAADAVVDVGDPADATLLTAEEMFALADPFIGAGGGGFGYASLTPAAQQPNGLIKVGPDTTTAVGSHPSFNHFSGYYALDTWTRGFSHLRLVGTGAADLGNLRLLPMGALQDRAPWERRTPIDKESEDAEPGWYTIAMPEEGVVAEMAAGLWTAAHRYTWSGGEAWLQIDAASSIIDRGAESVHIGWTGTAIEGSVTYRGSFTGRSNPFTLHYVIVPDPLPDTVDYWTDDGDVEGSGVDTPSRAVSEVQGGAVLGWVLPDTGEVVDLRVGVSLISLENARAHLDAELPDGADVDDLRAAARSAWLEKFQAARVATPSPRERVLWSTFVYDAYRMPTRLDELDGQYMGMDLEPHTLPEGARHLTDLSLWDSFRTLHPWYELTDPTLAVDSVESLLRMYEDGGRVPRWPAMLSRTGSMIGSSANMLFAGAFAKGLQGPDYDALLDAALDTDFGGDVFTPTEGRDAIIDYAALGYVPSDGHDHSVSETLEYAWADFSLAQLATGLDREAAVIDRLAELGRSWEQHYDADTGFLVARDREGTFDDVRPGAVYMNDGPYREGSAWHWGFYGFQEPAYFASVLGAEGLGDQLDEAFTRSQLGLDGAVSHALPDPYYWHGNEPQIHAAYLYPWSDRPEEMGHWVRQIQTRLYGTGVDGIPGNDDGGTLSSWYLFSAIGLYPIAGTDLYVIGLPIVPRAVIAMGDAGTLEVQAVGGHAATTRVVSVTLDGAPVEGPTVRHADLIDAVLRFELE